MSHLCPALTASTWQGLLVHVFFVLLRGATFRYASPLNRFNKSASSPTWTVNHFFSGHKPWKKTARCAEYFDFLTSADFHAANNRSECAARLYEKMACVRGELSADTCTACMRQRQKTAWTCGAPGFVHARGCGACRRKQNLDPKFPGACVCEMRPRCPEETWWRVI